MKALEKLSRKIGFSKTEIEVILFLIVMFLIGFTISMLNPGQSIEHQEYDYSLADSLYQAVDDDEELEDDTLKTEMLGGNQKMIVQVKKEDEVKEKSIDLNTATKEMLQKVPGIGEKTAGNIINYRQSIGKFKNMNELLNVSRIGDAKLQKIKKYIYIK
jgi:comEA protein